MESADGPCSSETLINVFDCGLYNTTCVVPGHSPAYDDCAATVAMNPWVSKTLLSYFNRSASAACINSYPSHVSY